MSHLFSPPILARLSCLVHLINLDWFQLFPLLLPLLGCQKRSSFLHFRSKHSPTHQDSTLPHWNNSRHSRDVCRYIWLPSIRMYKSLVYFLVKLKGSRSSLKYSYCFARPPCGSLVSTQIISEFLVKICKCSNSHILTVTRWSMVWVMTSNLLTFSILALALFISIPWLTQ